MKKYTKEFIEYKIAEKFLKLLDIKINFRNGDPVIKEPDIVGDNSTYIEIFSVHYSQDIKKETEFKIKKDGKAWHNGKKWVAGKIVIIGDEAERG